LADNIYSVNEIVGSSTVGIDDAIKGALTRAAQTVRNLDWFEVKEIRGHIEDDGNHYFQVTVKVGFRVEDRVKD
jgi:dodecin